jgi:mannose-6-phosphate isomerase-like protein (cupin superfamily)
MVIPFERVLRPLHTEGVSGPRLFLDPYRDWARGEGVPIVTGFGVDLLRLELAPWPRIGARGAFVHLDGRGDFIDVQVWEIPPAGQTSPLRHLYESVAYVLEGTGSTTVEIPGGGSRSFEWRTGSLFAIPLNARYRHHSGSGSRPARLAAVTSAPIVINLFRSSAFVFDNEGAFPDRFGPEEHFRGDGTLIPSRPGRHLWETNFVPDLRSFKLSEWKERGAGGSNMVFALADGTMHAHVSEMPVGTYKKAHRHGPDFHIFPVTGQGYSVYWYEGAGEIERFDWRPGSVFAPADRQFHQHFNVSPEPARYLAVAFGSHRYPTVADKMATWMGMDVSVKEGGRQIEYEDEDPRIRRMYESELATRGIPSRMDEVSPAPARA